jgi:subtilase family serine protease
MFNRGDYGQGITIGIVDAYYNSQTLSDLVGFSTAYHLPLSTGTSTITCPGGNPTVTIVSQTGGAPTAAFNSGWAQETDLDMQYAHTIAPCANLLLVTGNSADGSDLFSAVQYAYAHADVVSNSYGGSEAAGEAADDTFFSGSPVPLVFSAGDASDVTEYPCTSPYATCIGGTNLLTTSNTVRTLESVWYTSSTDGTGGGCSVAGGETQPTYQSSPSPGFTTALCGTQRGAPDIAALADPLSGVNIYFGTNIEGTAGVYCCIGGTSLAAPLTAGMIALVDQQRVAASKAKLNLSLNTHLYGAASWTPGGTDVQPAPYGNAYRSIYYDVYSGNEANTYWDRVTGLGVPILPSLSNYLVTQVP